MAVSNAFFSGPTKAEYELQSRQQLRQGFDSLGNAIFDNRKFGEDKRQFDTEQERLRAVAAEQQRQFNVQRASQDLSEYIKAQGGDFAYAAQRNPDAFRNYARLAFPDVNPDAFTSGIANGAQTYIQGLQASMAEIGRGSMGPEMAQVPQVETQVTPGATPPATTPKQTEPGTTPGEKAPSRTPNQNQTQIRSMDTDVQDKTADWDKLRKAFKPRQMLPGEDIDMLGLSYGGGAYQAAPGEAQIKIAPTPEMQKTERDLNQLRQALVTVRERNQRKAETSDTPPDMTEYNSIMGKLTAKEKELQALTAKAEAEAKKRAPAQAGEEISEKELSQLQTTPEYQAVQKMMRDQGVSANEAIASLELAQVQQQGSREALAGARYEVPMGGESSVQMPAGGAQASIQPQTQPQTPAQAETQAKVETAQKVDQKAGTSITKYLYQGKDINELSAKEKVDLNRQLEKATQGAIREFKVNRKLDPEGQEAQVAQRYATMSNALLELGLDLPSTHPVMREVMQFSRNIEDANKTADTELKLAQAALARAGIMTKEQASAMLKIKQQELDLKEAELAIQQSELMQNGLKMHFDALDDAVKSWQTDVKTSGRKVTNSFADAYKYNPQVKQVWDNIQEYYKAMGIKPPEIPPEITYEEVKGGWRSLPIISIFANPIKSTVRFGGGEPGGTATPNQSQELSPEAQAFLNAIYND